MIRYLFIILLYLMTSSYAFALSELKIVVREDGTGDYTSVAAAVNASPGNLTSLDQYLSIEIQGPWQNPDTDTIPIAGYITDDTRDVRIYTVGEARHNGKWSNTAYRCSPATDDCITFSDNNNPINITIDGLQLAPRGDWCCGLWIHYINEGSKLIFSNNIVDGSANALTSGIYSRTEAFPEAYVFNNIIYECWSGWNGAMRLSGAGANWYIFNNTFAWNDLGIMSDDADTITLINNVCYQNTGHGDYITEYQPCKVGSGYNISSDGTADDYTNGVNNTSNVTLGYTTDFVDAEGYDFHIKDPESALYNAGTDVYGNISLPITSDIDGDTISVRNDVGADEWVSGDPVPRIMFKNGVVGRGTIQ